MVFDPTTAVDLRAQAELLADLRQAVVRGQRSFWSLPGQISLGTGVATLESRNGRPLLLAGIGPHQGGHIVS